MKNLSVQSIPTRILHAREDVISWIAESVEALIPGAGLEGKILAVTSKVVSLSEGELVSKDSVDKETLVKREADQFIGYMGYGSFLTIKHGLLMASSGIDESNSESGGYILYPKKPFQSAQDIRQALMKRWNLKSFGVILTDSRTSILRKGVTGVALAHVGFRGIQDKVGTTDLFGARLKMTQVNVADALAVAAVFCMGESDESTPLALVKAPVEFTDDTIETYQNECSLKPEADLYWPLLSGTMKRSASSE